MINIKAKTDEEYEKKDIGLELDDPSNCLNLVGLTV